MREREQNPIEPTDKEWNNKPKREKKNTTDKREDKKSH